MTALPKKHILFVCPYPFNEAPSQRFRFEQYLSILKNEGFEYTLAPFLSVHAWQILYKKENRLTKIISVLLSFLKRAGLLFRLRRYNFIFIHREATPLGPPFFEWSVRFIWRKKIIYDFDDAIWLDDPNEKGSFKALLKWKWKVKNICKWSYKVSCGNQYLADYAKQFNPLAIVNPTTIDTRNLHVISTENSSLKEDRKPVIGWTGTHSTMHYLLDILPALEKLQNSHQFTFLIISNREPAFELASLSYRTWNKGTEIQDLNAIDIGVMPLTDDPWSKGKCGFKALQYMALGKPVIASPVGLNQQIITEGLNGYLAETTEDWINAAERLIQESALRKEMGHNGHRKVENHFSVESNKNNFLSLFS